MELTEFTLKLSDLFYLRPLSDKTTVVRINFANELLHPILEPPSFNWMIIDATLAKVEVMLDIGAVVIIPHVAEKVYLDATRLPNTFAAALQLVLSNYIKNKKKLEKKLNESHYKGTF